MIRKSFAAVALAGSVVIAGCTVKNDGHEGGAELSFKEDGIYKCDNESTGGSISFDSKDPEIEYEIFSGSLMVHNLETGKPYAIKVGNGWVCEMPSGEIYPMELQ